MKKSVKIIICILSVIMLDSFDSSAFLRIGTTIQLHRKNGTKKGEGAESGKSCNCVRCFGACWAKLADEADPENTVMDDLGGGTAKIYLLVEPDDDVTVDATFFVDENVEVLNAGITISSGEYSYSNTGGTVTLNGTPRTYYGTVVVSFTNNE